MIQKIPQDLQSLASEAMKMPPLFHGKSSKNPKKSLVSTTLCLSSCENPNKRKMNTNDDTKVSCRPSDDKSTNEERKIKRMRYLSNEEKAEEEWYGVSTELTLFKDPWIIKKELTNSDLGQLSRLLLHTGPIEDHIIKYLNNDDKNNVQEGLGITVDVYDHDTDSTFELILKRWTTLNSYVLNGGWRMYFIRRRGLRKGDKIGLFWDRFASRLHFRVLSRASTEVFVDQKNPN
ncbi:DNA-binding pseudobarrel domain superfamily [Arabidopsis suecica]|uniref:DNA-binding pseudobarrel domain superfamily n=1 Tax=Arabidopsis suecica TaxID=45249 RepID=A0A8T1ZVR7_ARASU|nr:DNA-binding pseudobarrel domain superfamily [Arabidopsis suecica]